MPEDWFFVAVFAIQLFLCCFAVLFFASGLDDFVVDCCYVFSICAAPIRHARKRAICEETLKGQSEQTIAVMVPAWDESDVIRPMLTNILKTFLYKNFHIFVGVYPNDFATQAEVEKVRQDWTNVHGIVCANPGPTCKADCLNWVYQGIQRFEKQNGVEFAIFVMEDCEDVVHPLSLHLFNSFVPEYDMVQIPVFPLERSWKDLTSGTYIDEFCEYHGKDIFVRQMLTGSIPAAGVGCAFSRRAYQSLAARHDGELFNTGSLTEDYEMGLRVGQMGLKSIFVSQKLEGFAAPERGWRPRGKPDARIAVREYFPSTFRTSFRQKSRWVLGIAFQGWKNLGWRGGPASRYMLYRDRKAIVTNYISVLGYVVVPFVSGLWLYASLVPDSYRYPPLVEKGSWLWYLLLANFFFLVNRAFWRWLCVYRVFGWRQSALAVPRQVWSNIVNGRATNRAVYLYVRSLISKKKIAWDKTAHVLPSQLALDTQRRIGDLLIDNNVLRSEDLQQALDVQKVNPAPLGFLLTSLGYVSEDKLLPVLADQLGMSYQNSIPIAPPELRELVSREFMIRYSCYPIGKDDAGCLDLAICEVPSASDRYELETRVGMQVTFVLTTRSQLGLALRYGTGLEKEEIGREFLAKRIEYLRLGDVLVKRQTLNARILKDAVDRFCRDPQGLLFGHFLVQHSFIKVSELEEALHEQSLYSLAFIAV
ncbi:MAG: glycosyl transferase family protein [Bryobacteraceae bacterium]